MKRRLHKSPPAKRTPAKKLKPQEEFVCPVCHKSFGRKVNLSQHSVVHEKNQLIWCKICGKKVYQYDSETHKIHPETREHCNNFKRQKTQQQEISKSNKSDEPNPSPEIFSERIEKTTEETREEMIEEIEDEDEDLETFYVRQLIEDYPDGLPEKLKNSHVNLEATFPQYFKDLQKPSYLLNQILAKEQNASELKSDQVSHYPYQNQVSFDFVKAFSTKDPTTMLHFIHANIEELQHLPKNNASLSHQEKVLLSRRFVRVCVFNCPENPVFFYFVPNILEVLETILLDSEAYSDMEFIPRKESQISEFVTAGWFDSTYHSVRKKLFGDQNARFKLLALFLYSDSSNVNKWGNRSLHPIICSLGNNTQKFRGTQDAKRIIGYLPNITNKQIPKDIPSKIYPQLRAFIFHKCLKHLIAPLDHVQKTGVELQTANGLEFFYPTLAVYICDTPEADLVSCCGKNDCRCCSYQVTLNPKFENNHHDKENRDREIVSKWRTGKLETDECGDTISGLRLFPTAFEDQIYFNEFSGSVPFEWLHNGQLGIAAYIVTGTFMLLQSYSTKAIDQLALNFEHLSSQTGWRGLPTFKLTSENAVEFSKSIHKASVVATLCRFLVFCIRGIDLPEAKEITKCCVNYCQIETIQAKDKLSPETLNFLEELYMEFESSIDVFRPCFPSGLDTKKMLATKHNVTDIRQNGRSKNFDSETYEQFHLIMKQQFRATSKTQEEDILFEQLGRQESLRIIKIKSKNMKAKQSKSKFSRPVFRGKGDQSTIGKILINASNELEGLSTCFNNYMSAQESLGLNHLINIYSSMFPLPGDGIQSPEDPPPVWANQKKSKFDDVQIQGEDGLWFAKLLLLFSCSDSQLNQHELAFVQYYNRSQTQFPEIGTLRIFESEANIDDRAIIHADSIENRVLLIPDFAVQENFFFVFPPNGLTPHSITLTSVDQEEDPIQPLHPSGGPVEKLALVALRFNTSFRVAQVLQVEQNKILVNYFQVVKNNALVASSQQEWENYPTNVLLTNFSLTKGTNKLRVQTQKEINQILSQ